MIKNTTTFKNTVDSVLGREDNGLVYSNIAVGDLVNKDTDGDGVLDWEEPLWGLDPTERETTPGVPDGSVVAKLKVERGANVEGSEGSSQNTQNLTQTDKFSQELFSTVATLNQGGSIDQATVDQISSSLMARIKNTPPKKIYVQADIKQINDNSAAAVKKYFDTLNVIIHKKYPEAGNILDVMQRFVIDENNVDTSVLAEINPINVQLQDILNEIVKTSVPSGLAQVHLEYINSVERLIENLNDIMFYESDVILALGGIVQYQTNIALYETSTQNLMNAINKKLLQ